MTDVDIDSLLEPPKQSKPAPKVLTKSTIGKLPILSVDEQPPFVNMLIYGESGIGKTVLAGSASAVPEMGPVLFVDVEGGTFSLRDLYPDCDVVRVRNWVDLQDVYDDLFGKKLPYKTVVLDSLSEMQKFSMYGIMEALVKAEEERDPDVPGLREWGKNSEQVRKMVRAFRDLPINTIFTALVREDRNPKTGKVTTKPGLSGKVSGEVAAFLDFVFYMYVKVVDGTPQRLLLAKATEDTIAKDRSNKLATVIESPDMKKLYTNIFGD